MKMLWLASGLIIILAAVAIGAAWVWTWPVACSTRGCITRQAWNTQLATANRFAQATGASTPTPAEALTTLIRQHLVNHAQVITPVSLADAGRYRKQILNLKEPGQLQGALNLSLEDYDQKIILPFLQQEALRTRYKTKSIDELYAALARERTIILLLPNYRWDKATGKVSAK